LLLLFPGADFEEDPAIERAILFSGGPAVSSERPGRVSHKKPCHSLAIKLGPPQLHSLPDGGNEAEQ
jgi:hypothetical protein